MDLLTVDDKILIMENKTVAQARLVPSPVSIIQAMELCPWPSTRPAPHPGIHFLWTTLGYTQYTNMDFCRSPPLWNANLSHSPYSSQMIYKRILRWPEFPARGKSPMVRGCVTDHSSYTRQLFAAWEVNRVVRECIPMNPWLHGGLDSLMSNHDGDIIG